MALSLAIYPKHINTQVRIEEGGTVLIGGIFENPNNQNTAQLPILGDIPILGWLFKQTSRKDLKQELMVFITPKMQVQHAVAQ